MSTLDETAAIGQVDGFERALGPRPVPAAPPRLRLERRPRVDREPDRGSSRAASALRHLRTRALTLDLAAVTLGSLIVARFSHGGGSAGALMTIAYPLVVLAGIHGRRPAWDEGSLLDELRRVVGASTVSALALLGAAALLHDRSSAPTALRPWAVTLALLCAARILRSQLLRGLAPQSLRPTLIVGAGRVGSELAEYMRQNPSCGLRPVGFLDEERAADRAQPRATPAATAIPVLGPAASLVPTVASTGAECVVFAYTRQPDERLLPLMEECEAMGLTVFIVPRLYETTGWPMRPRSVGALPLGEVRTVDPRSLPFTIKHAADRILAAALLAVLTPLLMVIALLVRVSSPGPVWYRQRRVGRDGREFTMLKFRTMHEGILSGAVFRPAPGFAPGGVEDADRRTRLGICLRRASLDELPQLINVLRGDMSLIGPRPERPEYVRIFGDEVSRYNRRHRVKSGITGLAQVSGLRGQTSVSERARYDNAYIQNWSLWLDIKIALRTIATVMTLRGE